jgi:NADH-quinone oxidoreductase subunit C
MKSEIMDVFSREMLRLLGESSDLTWDVDRKGVVCGWCSLPDPADIYTVAELMAKYKGRVMTISPLNTPADFSGIATAGDSEKEKRVELVINYHFFFEGINFTARITLPDDTRTVRSITPVLISADWHEREMRELFNITLIGHPNPKRLFLDESIHMTDHTMIPLSEAMDGASTSTLWEKIMKAGKKGADERE